MDHQQHRTCSPRSLARALGLGESTIKRWVDAELLPAERTPGGHRRIPLQAALRFLRQRGLGISDHSALGLPALDAVNEGRAEVQAWLEAGEGEALGSWLCAQYLAGTTLAPLFDGPIRESFSEIGTYWQDRPDGILIEHRAVDAALRGITQVRELLPEPAEDAPLAICAAPAGDPYLLPALMLSMVLQEAGWRSMNLGPNTPVDTLCQSLESLQPQLLCLSCSATDRPSATELQQLLRAAQEQACQLVLGGRRAPALPAGAEGIRREEDLAALTHLARALRGA